MSFASHDRFIFTGAAFGFTSGVVSSDRTLLITDYSEHPEDIPLYPDLDNLILSEDGVYYEQSLANSNTSLHYCKFSDDFANQIFGEFNFLLFMVIYYR